MLINKQPINELSKNNLEHFRNNNFKHKGKTVNPPKSCVQSCRCEKILRTRNFRRKFTKGLLPKKLKENM